MKAKYLPIAVCVVSTLWLANWILVKSLIGSAEEQGQFGDMFGATNALFSGLTIVGLLYTIYLQREDIQIARESFKQQKEELELNRQELILTRKEFKLQNKTLSLQRFENTFFNMLNLQADIVNNLPEGRTSFFIFRSEILERLADIPDVSYDTLQYEYFRLLHKTIPFGQYVGNFEKLVEIIIEAKKTAKGRSKYLRILFSQVTLYEKIFLIYHFNLRERLVKPKYYEEYKRILFADLPSGYLIKVGHDWYLDGMPNYTSPKS